MHAIRVKLHLLIAGDMPVALKPRLKKTLELASPGVVQNVTLE